MDDKPDSSFLFFCKRLEYVPRYVVDYTFGLLAAIISDVTITTIALASIALGFGWGHWLLAVAFFFTLYSILRIMNMLAMTLGGVGQMISNSMRPPQPPMIVNQAIEPTGPDLERIPVTLPPVNG